MRLPLPALSAMLALPVLATPMPLLAAVVRPSPVNAVSSPDILTGGNVEALAALLRESGFKAQIKTNNDGIRYIDSAANGSFFTISFTDCGLDSGCASLRFLAWWDRPAAFTTRQTNEWNTGYKLARAAIDADDDLILDYYISLKGGVSRENFLDVFDWWSLLLVDFRKFMEEKELETTKDKPASGDHSGTGPDARDEDRAG